MRRIISMSPARALARWPCSWPRPAALAAKSKQPTPRDHPCASDARQRRRHAHDQRQGLQGQAEGQHRHLPRRRTAARRLPSRVAPVAPSWSWWSPRRSPGSWRSRQQATPDPLQAARARRQVQQVHVAAPLAGRAPGGAPAAVTAPAPRSATTAPAATTTTTCCSTARELDQTDPASTDTDSTASSDGWEYCSAKDLERNAVPYPG